METKQNPNGDSSQPLSQPVWVRTKNLDAGSMQAASVGVGRGGVSRRPVAPKVAMAPHDTVLASLGCLNHSRRPQMPPTPWVPKP